MVLHPAVAETLGLIDTLTLSILSNKQMINMSFILFAAIQEVT